MIWRLRLPWLLLPAVPILLTFVSFNVLEEALRDALTPERQCKNRAYPRKIVRRLSFVYV